MQKVLNGTVKRSSVNVVGEDEEGLVPPIRHQLIMLAVHSEPVCALLDSGAILDIMSQKNREEIKIRN